MSLPDPDISLREAADYILTSRLGRKAQTYNDIAGLTLFWRDLLGQIHRLVTSCHMAEFTDHGLPHLCSLVDRVSEWTCAPNQSIERPLVELLSPADAAILLTSILIHDIGMLSQSPSDLPDSHPMANTQGSMNIASWVRSSHVPRIARLVRRLLMELPDRESNHTATLNSELFTRSLIVAEAHSIWPWERAFEDLPGNLQGLASVLSVADILDEDSNRCDTPALLFHRHGSQENKAHWIRHTLTAERVYVKGGRIEIRLLRLPNTDIGFEPVFQALRNQYQLAKTYNRFLRDVGAGLLEVTFDPPSSFPQGEVKSLHGWETLRGYETQELLLHNLLKTFFSEALLDNRRLDPAVASLLIRHGLVNIDLEIYYSIRGLTEIRSPIEEELHCGRVERKSSI